MRMVLRGALGLVVLLVGLVLHYSLPQHDIVRIVGTDVKRMDVGERSWFWAEPDTATAHAANRDVRFVNAVDPEGEAAVYRNEDTNWSYPPYLKFESGSLTARAQALVSTEAAPVWAVVTHYGWRIELFTMFPNVVGIRRAEGPDESIFPWFNTIFLLLLAILLLLLTRMAMRLRRRVLDPVRQEGPAAAGARRPRWRDIWKATSRGR